MFVLIIDYGSGNIKSVYNSVKKTLNNYNISIEVKVSNNLLEIKNAYKIILPGVGSFFDAMKELEQKSWVPAIKEHVSIKERPLLGICLGMQLLASVGNEGGKVDGLDLIPGEVKHLTDLGCKERVPHIGWNEIKLKKESVIFNGIFSGHDFYFVHSYAFMPSDAQHISAIVSYSNDVVASVENKNVFGTQFHPEKSSKAGLRILQNFLAL